MFNNIFITSLIHFWHYPCAFTFYSFPKGLSNMAKKRICLWQQEIIRTIWFHFHWKSYFLCTPCSFFSLTSSRFYFLFHLTMCRSTVLDTSPRLTNHPAVLSFTALRTSKTACCSDLPKCLHSACRSPKKFISQCNPSLAWYRYVSNISDCHLKMFIARHLRLDQATKMLQANYRENISVIILSLH